MTDTQLAALIAAILKGANEIAHTVRSAPVTALSSHDALKQAHELVKKAKQ